MAPITNKRSAAAEFAKSRWENVISKPYNTVNQDGVVILVDARPHPATLNVEIQKIEPSRPTQPIAPVDEQPIAHQITINKLDKSRLSPFEQQPLSFGAIVKDKPTAGKKLDLSRSLFNQPSPSSAADAQDKVTSAPNVNRLDSSRFSLFGQRKQENKVVSSIVDKNVDEKPLVQIDRSSRFDDTKQVQCERSAATEYAKSRWESVIGKPYNTINQDGVVILVDARPHPATLYVEIKKIEPSRLSQFETKPTVPTVDEQPTAQTAINKLDKSRLSAFEQQPTSLDAIIVKDKPAVDNQLDLSSHSLFIQPSSSVDAQDLITSAPKVNKLNLSRFSLFGKPKQNVERENKVASSIVDTDIDELPLIRLDQLVVEVTDHHENTVSTCGTKNKSPIPSQNADDPSVPLFEQQPMQPSSTAAAAINPSAPILNKLNSSPLSGPKVVSRRYYDYNHLNHWRHKTKKEKKQEKKLMAAMETFIASTDADDGTLVAQHDDREIFIRR